MGLLGLGSLAVDLLGVLTVCLGVVGGVIAGNGFFDGI